ncbi:restriction endonuclease subunit S [Roseateles albus]|uniref:Restriction endonuclease subunit S n=1 Tax=Roseateles albus TaxID=2987525 RepID=A0ABT5KAH2_9BURK|nr:restriction endonuclease subunit S [Roseateles albus]MDC8770938.1 restriction endonuclease subunit S [Roseateles albus]
MSLPKYGEYKDSGVTWLGPVPAHWTVVQSRRYFANRNEKAVAGDKQLTASQKHGVIYQTDFMELEGHKVVQVIVGADILKRAEPNDFVISMRSFQGGIEWCGLRGSISSAYVMLVPNDAIWSPFYRYLFKSAPYIQALQATTNLVRDGQALRFSNFAQVTLPLLAVEEQQKIAAFLDRETSKINVLIAEQEKLITLLAEKRQATISQAVTRGLNPEAPMKDSGVTWLGNVPAHWDVRRLKHLVQDSIAGPYGSSLTKSMYVSAGYRVYGQQQVIPDDFSLGDYYISEEKFAEMSRYRVRPDDVLISVMGTIGRAAVIPNNAEPGIINPRLVLYRVIEQLISPRYLQTFLNNSTSQRYFSLAAQGTTMEGLNMASIGELYVALPPPREQVEILKFIRLECQKLFALSAEAERAVCLLMERRSALIAAAVTGQIDVRQA